MPTVLVAILVGLVVAMIVNILADVLPQFRLHNEEDEDAETLLPTHDDEAANQDRQSTKRITLARFISVRYLIVTVMLVGISVYLWHAETISVLAPIKVVYIALFTLIGVIDIEHRLVLTVIMIPAFILAFIEISISRRIFLADALVGYAAAQLVQMAFYFLGGVYLMIVNARRDEPLREIAFGFGDVTLATFCGMVIGYPDVLVMLILMVLIGGLMGFVYLIIRLVIARKYQAHMAIPYGPAIVIATALMLVWGSQITTMFLNR